MISKTLLLLASVVLSQGEPFPTAQPTQQPSSQPSMWWGSFVGFNQFNCDPGCDPGTVLSLPLAEITNGWSSDTGGVNMICSNCHQNWWQLHPAFGDYTGNYVFLQPLSGDHGTTAPWDIRLSYTFHGLTPGGSYYVGFWQQYRDIGALASWTVSLGGTVVYNTLPTLSPEYVYSAKVVATSTSLTLVMEAINNVNGYRSIWLNGVTLMQPSPTGQPTNQPTKQPTVFPSSQPSQQPTRQPSSRPNRPSSQPSVQPSAQPSKQPSGFPTRLPSAQVRLLPYPYCSKIVPIILLLYTLVLFPKF